MNIFSEILAMKLCTSLLYFFLVVAVKSLEKARYDNYRVYEILIENYDQSRLMEAIEENPDGVNLKICYLHK